ncbi:MAG: hypothetical protein WC384_06060 [Prolixibacteraceae bacterium]|jgi:hypothetical protein
MSFNQNSQILEEIGIMEQFRINYAEFPKGKLLKSESPDFIVSESPKKTIGIELTKLHEPTINKFKTHYPTKIIGYLSPEMNRENIQFTINAKNEKLAIYHQKKLNQLWLLITADIEQCPVSYNLPNKLNNWEFYSGFQKVFLFELKAKKIYELNVLI